MLAAIVERGQPALEIAFEAMLLRVTDAAALDFPAPCAGRERGPPFGLRSFLFAVASCRPAPAPATPPATAWSPCWVMLLRTDAILALLVLMVEWLGTSSSRNVAGAGSGAPRTRSRTRRSARIGWGFASARAARATRKAARVGAERLRPTPLEFGTTVSVASIGAAPACCRKRPASTSLARSVVG